ncbi:pentatricopeptide repeat-containing protein 1, mitochondrial-like [Patiria miniata]|uniref:Pentatricopeptide repeat-containing protein 1, mitochondrial n=1 Tax=Patiria miniata TaxID=46514 RepID=A0A914AXI3_PATMI|nr:pentatricopeptide repeat-containing protein 1, mitochondrial-like [Patiria miniata]XP_038068404.1 pentatricopeptide repeat-containing protein 1, mitochondrial-like [Patiria miniata]XP_038068405.1 pentatricopeptide repeat-containing protein 1, mitochondrial-like [Patiria miniata]
MTKLFHPVQFLQCQMSIASRSVLHRRSSVTLSHFPRFFAKDDGILRIPSVTPNPWQSSKRTLASFPRLHLIPCFRVYVISPQSLSMSAVAAAYQRNNLSSPCYSLRAWFSQASRSLNPSGKTDQEKERVLLSEYGRTYSATKRYTERRLWEQESDSEELVQERLDDLPPEDTFGTLTNKYEKKFHVKGDAFDLEVDSEDKTEGQSFRPPGRQNTPDWYGNQMKKLCKEGKLLEAIDVLEVRMLKEDRVQPIEFNYDVLIGACGREGYTKKAFKLYNQMKKRGLRPSDVTFTGLFNACAESPWPLTDGLTRLRHLHSQLQEKGITVNQITHHAMIKAYAKCGDLPVAFDLFRDLLSSGVELTSESFAFLLFACASDKERGLLYAIEAWRQMLQRGIKPDIYTYNLLLRIARDCGIGDPEAATRVLLKQAEKQSEMLPAPKKKGKTASAQRSAQPKVQRSQDNPMTGIMEVKPLGVEDEVHQDVVTGATDSISQLGAAEKTLVPQQEELPNLLDLSPDTSRVHSLANVSTASDRLALLGGASGILASMKNQGVIPDVKSLTLMMESLPMTTQDEERLLEVVDEYKVRVDVDFYNAIIRRRSRRADLEGAKAVLPLIQQKGLFPNLRTFVNLACECSRAKDGIQLLKDMKVAGLNPTVNVYDALVTAAARNRDYWYQTELLKCMEKDKVSPNERILQKLETMAAFGQNPYKGSRSNWATRQQTRLNHFRGVYTKWLDRMGLEETPHPWKKFYRPRGDPPASLEHKE